MLIDHQGRTQPQGIFSRSQYQEALSKRGIDDRIAQALRALLGVLMLNDFNADHQTAATNVAHDLEFAAPAGQARENVFAHAASVGDVFGFEQAQGDQRGGYTHRVPPKR